MFLILQVCWKYVSGITITVLLVVRIWTYTDVMYNNTYQYPQRWLNVGYILQLIPIMAIPIGQCALFSEN